MKKLLLLFILLTATFSLHSQDLIIKTNGELVKCRILVVDSTNVYYSVDKDSIESSLPKSEIRDIRYDKSRQAGADSIHYIAGTDRSHSVTVGFLEGGGSLVGLDIETLIWKNFGFQVGCGVFGFGAGLNWHFKPTVRSSFVSLQYWHQGFANTYTQSLIGPNLVIRANKVFTAQIGMGYAIEKGTAWPQDRTQPKVMLTYAIGCYFPF